MKHQSGSVASTATAAGAEVAEELLLALYRLAASSSANRNALHAEKAELVVVAALRRHSDCSSVAAACFRAVAALLDFSGAQAGATEAAAGQEVQAEENAAEGRVVEILLESVSDASSDNVCSVGASTQSEEQGRRSHASGVLGSWEPDEAVEASALRLVRADGCAVLARALLRHADSGAYSGADLDLAQLGSRVQAAIALIGRVRLRHGSGGSNSSSGSIHTGGCSSGDSGSSSGVSGGSARKRRQAPSEVLATLGACEAPAALCSVLQHHLSHVDIVSSAVTALACLAELEQNLSALYKAGADVLVVAVLRRHFMFSEALVSSSLLLLHHLCVSDACRASLGDVEVGGADAVLVSLAHQLQSPRAARLGCDAMSALCLSPAFDARAASQMSGPRGQQQQRSFRGADSARLTHFQEVEVVPPPANAADTTHAGNVGGIGGSRRVLSGEGGLGVFPLHSTADWSLFPSSQELSTSAPHTASRLGAGGGEQPQSYSPVRGEEEAGGLGQESAAEGEGEEDEDEGGADPLHPPRQGNSGSGQAEAMGFFSRLWGHAFGRESARKSSTSGGGLDQSQQRSATTLVEMQRHARDGTRSVGGAAGAVEGLLQLVGSTLLSTGLTDQEEEEQQGTAAAAQRKRKQTSCGALVGGGATALLFTLLEKHAQHNGVLLAAANALNSLGLQSEFRSELNREGIFALLVAAFERCTAEEVEAIQEEERQQQHVQHLNEASASIQGDASLGSVYDLKGGFRAAETGPGIGTGTEVHGESEADAHLAITSEEEELLIVTQEPVCVGAAASQDLPVRPAVPSLPTLSAAAPGAVVDAVSAIGKRRTASQLMEGRMLLVVLAITMGTLCLPASAGDEGDGLEWAQSPVGNQDALGELGLCEALLRLLESFLQVRLGLIVLFHYMLAGCFLVLR